MIGVDISNRGAFLKMATDAAAMDADVRSAIRQIARDYNRIVASELSRPKTGRLYGRVALGGQAGRQRYRVVGRRVNLFGGRKAIVRRRVAYKQKQTVTYRASRPGETPARFTGNLLRGLRVAFPNREKGYGARVFSRRGLAGHRHLLEFGTSERFQTTKSGKRRSTGRVLPRPIWSSMQKRALDDLQKRILRVIDANIAFRGGA